MWRRLNSLQGRLTLLLLVAGLAGASIYAGVTQWPLSQLWQWLHTDLAVSIRAPVRLGIYGSLLASMMVLLPLTFWLAGQVMAPVSRLLRALESAVASYRDGDFSTSIAVDRRDELGRLIRMHNELGQTLREQRQHLVQRELLLDTVVQNTPVALVLTDAAGRVTDRRGGPRRLRQHCIAAFVQRWKQSGRAGLRPGVGCRTGSAAAGRSRRRRCAVQCGHGWQ